MTAINVRSQPVFANSQTSLAKQSLAPSPCTRRSSQMSLFRPTPANFKVSTRIPPGRRQGMTDSMMGIISLGCMFMSDTSMSTPCSPARSEMLLSTSGARVCRWTTLGSANTRSSSKAGSAAKTLSACLAMNEVQLPGAAPAQIAFCSQ